MGFLKIERFVRANTMTILTLYLVKPRILGMAKYSYKKIHRKSIVRFFAKVNMLKHAQMIALSRELKHAF